MSGRAWRSAPAAAATKIVANCASLSSTRVAGGNVTTTMSEHEHGRRLAFADDIRCLGRHEQIVISRNLRPFKQAL